MRLLGGSTVRPSGRIDAAADLLDFDSSSWCTWSDLVVLMAVDMDAANGESAETHDFTTASASAPRQRNRLTRSLTISLTNFPVLRWRLLE